MNLFFAGALMGFSIAIPIGPVDFLCIRNSLAWGSKWGLLTGLGIATADALLGLIAGFSIHGLQSYIDMHDQMAHLIGSLFLCIMGILYLAKRQFAENPLPNSSGTFIMGFLMSASSPSTLLTFLGLFGISGLILSQFYEALLVGTGIFLGSSLWWVILSFSAVFFRPWFHQAHLTFLTRLMGVIFFMTGLISLFLYHK